MAKAERGGGPGVAVVGSAYRLLPPAHLLQPTTTVCVCGGWRVEKDYLCAEDSKWQGSVAKERNVLHGVYGDAAALSAAAAGRAVIGLTKF